MTGFEKMDYSDMELAIPLLLSFLWLHLIGTYIGKGLIYWLLYLIAIIATFHINEIIFALM